MTFTEAIKKRRKELGLRQEDAAQRAGFTSREQWTEFELMRYKDPHVSKFKAAAKALECQFIINSEKITIKIPNAKNP